MSRLDKAAGEARSAGAGLVEHGQKAIGEIVAAAEKAISEAAHSAEKTLKDSLEGLRARAHDYGEEAGDNFEDAQAYVIDRVKERPVTATLVGLGLGLLIGLLLSSRAK